MNVESQIRQPRSFEFALHKLSVIPVERYEKAPVSPSRKPLSFNSPSKLERLVVPESRPFLIPIPTPLPSDHRAPFGCGCGAVVPRLDESQSS